MRMHYLLSILADTRAEIIRAVFPPAPKARKKLPDLQRRKIVDHWAENGFRAAA
jgi:hypothetical protein